MLRQQFVDARSWVSVDAHEHILEICDSDRCLFESEPFHLGDPTGTFFNRDLEVHLALAALPGSRRNPRMLCQRCEVD